MNDIFKTIRSSFNSIIGRYSIIILVLILPLLTILYSAGFLGDKGVTAQKFIDLQQGDSAYYGFRRAHAKGICIAGSFESNGSLAQYSTATIFDKVATPFIGRFSIAGNNPHANDLDAPVRSLALKLLLANGQEWRMAMNTPPVTAVRTPEAFYQQLEALSPDPVTKKRDPQNIKAFFNAHPESKAFTTWNKNYKATHSFATERYHSINAFYLIDLNGEKHAVRWAAIPLAEKNSSALLDKNNADALQQELTNRLEQQPVSYSLTFTFANPDDDENDPTMPWPKTRLNINAGTIVINTWENQSGGACDGINFDPLVLPDGIQATLDPILRARSSAYAESYKRRAKEVLFDQHRHEEI